MDDLIAALAILRKYGNPHHPTWCEHDKLHVVREIDPEKVSKEDLAELAKLGFSFNSEGFYSYRFGSA